MKDFEDAGQGIRRPVRVSTAQTLQAPETSDLKKKKKKEAENKNNLTFSETGCDWLDPTLEHNVVPVFSSQWLSGQNRKKLTNIDGERSNK